MRIKLMAEQVAKAAISLHEENNGRRVRAEWKRASQGDAGTDFYVDYYMRVTDDMKLRITVDVNGRTWHNVKEPSGQQFTRFTDAIAPLLTELDDRDTAEQATEETEATAVEDAIMEPGAP
jgi:hypothetical protein|tara:strand:+ start:22195 stop:22557 length:363 start_codon:yes stop_codon:yes gene_type:complete